MPDESNTPEQQHTDMAGLTARLSLRPAEVYREIKAGTLKATTVEGRPLFAEADIKAFEDKRDTSRTELAAEIEKWNTELLVGNAQPEQKPEEGSPAKPEGSQPDETLQPEGAPTDDQKEAEKEKDKVPEDPAALAAAFADKLIRHAFTHGALDVYLDPVESGFRAMVRTEGGLEEKGRLSPRLGELVRQAMKVKLGKPDAVTQTVQCLTKIDHEGRSIQIQGTIAPTLLGEHVHLRFRDPQALDDLAALGYTAGQADAVRKLLDGRAGVLLVAGAADPFADRHRLGLANMLAAGNRLVVSLEHRVHFKSEILVQLTFSAQDGTDFGALMAAALAMSPDVLFVDDVRTADEAKGLFEAVAAGVAVVAQLRSPGNVEALFRLVEFGIGKDVLARDLLGMIARRSLRRLCPTCAEQRALAPEEFEILQTPPGTSVAVPGNCAECQDGFRGHRVLHDLWVNTAEMAALIAKAEPPAQELRSYGRTVEHGIGFAAREAVLAGDIALDDVGTTLLPTPGGSAT